MVLTHHRPTLVSEAHRITSAFATDLIPGQIDASQICVWASGHTHYNSDIVTGGARLFTNQWRYIIALSHDFDVRMVGLPKGIKTRSILARYHKRIDRHLMRLHLP